MSKSHYGKKESLSWGDAIGSPMGAAIGASAGLISVGPAGTVAGAALGSLISDVLKQVINRITSPREIKRASTAEDIAQQEISRRIAYGESIRDKGLVDSDSSKELCRQVFENVLVTAIRSFEEKKISFLGRLYANFAFDPFCSEIEANFLVHMTDHLTYSQLVLLHLFSEDGKRFSLRNKAYVSGEQIHYSTLTILQAIYELCRLNLVQMKHPGESTHTIILDINQIWPAHMILSVAGRRLHDMLELKYIPDSDMQKIADMLQTTIYQQEEVTPSFISVQKPITNSLSVSISGSSTDTGNIRMADDAAYPVFWQEL